MFQQVGTRSVPSKRDGGFSLVEVIAALAAGLVMLGAVLQSLSYFHLEFARQHARIIQQQDVRLGLELLAQELRVAGSLLLVRSDTLEFYANVSGFNTNLTAPAGAGQTTLVVEDGRGWPENKLVSVCWSEQCEHVTLARTGQRNILTIVEPASRELPSGALVMVMNRVRYYSRPDERGVLRWMRQIDGGASVIASGISRFSLSYWDRRGRPTTHMDSVRRVLVEIAFPDGRVIETREISLRT